MSSLLTISSRLHPIQNDEVNQNPLVWNPYPKRIRSEVEVYE